MNFCPHWVKASSRPASRTQLCPPSPNMLLASNWSMFSSPSTVGAESNFDSFFAEENTKSSISPNQSYQFHPDLETQFTEWAWVPSSHCVWRWQLYAWPVLQNQWEQKGDNRANLPVIKTTTPRALGGPLWASLGEPQIWISVRPFFTSHLLYPYLGKLSPALAVASNPVHPELNIQATTDS